MASDKATVLKSKKLPKINFTVSDAGYYVYDYHTNFSNGVTIGKIDHTTGCILGRGFCGKSAIYCDLYDNDYFERLSIHKTLEDAVKFVNDDYSESLSFVKDNLKFDGTLNKSEREFVESAAGVSPDEYQKLIESRDSKKKTITVSNPDSQYVNLEVKNVGIRMSADGKVFYAGYVNVPKNISEDSKAYIGFNSAQTDDIDIESHDFDEGAIESVDITIKKDKVRAAKVKINGKYETIDVTGQTIKEWNDEFHNAYNRDKTAIDIKDAMEKSEADNTKTNGLGITDFGN